MADAPQTTDFDAWMRALIEDLLDSAVPNVPVRRIEEDGVVIEGPES